MLLKFINLKRDFYFNNKKYENNDNFEFIIMSDKCKDNDF